VPCVDTLGAQHCVEDEAMGIDRWKEEHRAYRPDRPAPAEVSEEDRALDLPRELPVAPAAARPRRGKPKG
jgi:hypothetical protein